MRAATSMPYANGDVSSLSSMMIDEAEVLGFEIFAREGWEQPAEAAPFLCSTSISFIKAATISFPGGRNNRFF